MKVVAGIDLGGTAINYTIVNEQEQFLIEGLCEHPALSIQGPDVFGGGLVGIGQKTVRVIEFSRLYR